VQIFNDLLRILNICMEVSFQERGGKGEWVKNIIDLLEFSCFKSPLLISCQDHDLGTRAGKVQSIQNIFGVGHLGNSLGRNETANFNRVVAGLQEIIDVPDLHIGRDEVFQALETIARGLNYF